MATDTTHKDLEALRIDRSGPVGDGGSPWAKAYILGGVALVALLGLGALGYRFFASTPEVAVVRAQAEGGAMPGGVRGPDSPPGPRAATRRRGPRTES